MKFTWVPVDREQAEDPLDDVRTVHMLNGQMANETPVLLRDQPFYLDKQKTKFIWQIVSFGFQIKR